MQSSARAIISAVGRGAELLTDVDYHLADTAAEVVGVDEAQFFAADRSHGELLSGTGW